MPKFRELYSLPLTALAALCGVTVFQQLRELPDPLWAWLFLPLVALVWRYRRLLPIAIVAVGFLWAWLYAATILSEHLPVESEGRDLVAEGMIASVPKLDMRRAQFEFKVTDLFQDGEPLAGPGRSALEQRRNRTGNPCTAGRF